VVVEKCHLSRKYFGENLGKIFFQMSDDAFFDMWDEINANGAKQQTHGLA
jgi:hypothetical protein